MTFIDLGPLVKAEHEATKAEHLRVTGVSTGYHVEADRSEELGDYEAARQHRQTADEIQTAANRMYRPRAN